jgi:predicted DNA-binding transcriptional regulator YafY
MISDIIDMFGKDVRFSDETEDTVCVSVNVNEQSMILFAKNYAPDVVVIEPQTLRKKVIDELKKGVEAYK